MFIAIGQAATVLGVSISTLRRWERDNKLLPTYRTCGGHRRYNLEDIEALCFPALCFSKRKKAPPRHVVAYARVSSYDQKKDLERQVDTLADYCTKLGYEDFRLIKDLGSGINFNKRGLSQLINALCLGQVDKLILTHRDRLVRIGFPLLAKLCKFHGTEIVILGARASGTFEEELANDVIEILTVYTSRIYGRRSHDKRARAA